GVRRLHRLETDASVYAHERGVEADANVPGPLDLLDQIVRHAEGIAPHEQRHRGRISRQMHGCLAGGVAGADDEDVLTRERRRLRRRRSIEHAFSYQWVDAVDL